MPADRGPEEILRLPDATPEVEVDVDPTDAARSPRQGTATPVRVEPKVEGQPPVKDSFAARPPHAADPALRRRLLPWAIVAVVGVVLVLSAVAFTYTSFFHAQRLSVSGERHLTKAQVLRIGRLGPDTNVFHLNQRAAERRLEGNPWIARATLTRHLPQTLTIAIVERTPVALAVAGPGGSTPVLLAADGTVLGRASGSAPFPHVSTDDGTGRPSSAELRDGAEVVAAMPPVLREQVATVVVGSEGAVLVVTKGGVTVTYGDTSLLAPKAEALQAVLDYVAGAHERIVSIDVSVPGAPTADRPGGLGAVVGR
jgi:cell division protein FtsQ